MTLIRMPATALPDTLFCFNVLSIPPKTRIPTRSLMNALFLMSFSRELLLSMMPLIVLSRNTFSLTLFPILPA